MPGLAAAGRGEARGRGSRKKARQTAATTLTPVNLQFAIPGWAACGPGRASPDDWRAWAAAPDVPAGDPQPTLAQVPPMVRRRLNLLGRTTLQAAFDLGEPPAGTPVIFASRYGDASRGLDLLADLVRGDPLSPTSFGLSVHNAIGATYAIVRGDHANQLALAAGADSAVAALVEAGALLADGAPEVRVVYSEAPLPPDYAVFEDSPPALYAWAWRLTAPVDGAPRFVLSLDDGAERPAASPLPTGLDLLRVVAANAPAPASGTGATPWLWQRHDA